VGSQGPIGPSGAQGAVGALGATGPAGAVGMNFRGAWNSGIYYAVNDAATFGGTTYLASVAGSGAEPDVNPDLWAVVAEAGEMGPNGAAGVAATVSVGTVSTLAAGAAATVTNSGTEWVWVWLGEWWGTGESGGDVSRGELLHAVLRGELAECSGDGG